MMLTHYESAIAIALSWSTQLKLVHVDFHAYRSINQNIQECVLRVDPQTTCLVGVSESGKSNILEALKAFEDGSFSGMDLPAEMILGQPRGYDHEQPILSATYELTEHEFERFSPILNRSTKSGNRNVKFTHHYGRGIEVEGIVIEDTSSEISASFVANSVRRRKAIKSYVGAYARRRASNHPTTNKISTRITLAFNSLTTNIRHKNIDEVVTVSKRLIRVFDSIEKLPTQVTDSIRENERRNYLNAVAEVKSDLDELITKLTADDGVDSLLQARPVFTNIDTESDGWLKGNYTLNELIEADSATVPSSSVKRLFDLGNLDVLALSEAPNQVINQMLEAASSKITNVLTKAWQQDQISVSIKPAPRGGIDEGLIVTISSAGHEEGLPEQRSHGFRWFFEFLLAYAAAQAENNDIVVLLDEPGIHLHPLGQEDLKHQFSTVGPKTQIVYSTHLPNLVDINNLDSVRGVIKNPDTLNCTKILNEWYDESTQQTTWEVMLRALGVRDIGMNAAGRTIVLEGAADYHYL